MAVPAINSRYHIIPPSSEDSDHESSPRDSLLGTMNVSTRRFDSPTAYSLTVNLVLTLRTLSTILATATLVILILDGGDAFIAADIFLALLMILNVVMVIQHFLSDVFKVTVEFRRSAWKTHLGSQNRPRVAMGFDLGLSVCLMMSLVLGHALCNYWGGTWRIGVIIGYTVV